MRFITPKTRIAVAIVLVASLVSSVYAPIAARAQLAVTDPGVQAVATVSAQQNILTAVNSALSSASEYAMKYKEMVLDPLAWMLAKQLLSAMTTDVVNWINSGFDGKPAFLTDPGNFFLNIADDTASEFLSENGPLSGLCSPFSVDIRLALALNIAQNGGRGNRKKYSCSLSKVIGNFQNLPNSVTVNGQNINGFVNGDFTKGGWPAFISLTSDPQNSPIGAYLIAESDLNLQIAQGQAGVQAELQMGSGFLSYKKCEKVSIGGSTTDDPGNELNAGQTQTVCHTETPGSVISGALQKQLGAPVDELNIADEFDEIIGALFSQLVQGVLKGGLGSASTKQSGQTASLINSLQSDYSAGGNAGGAIGTLGSSVNDAIQPATDYLNIRQATAAAANDAKNAFTAAQFACTSAGRSDLNAQMQNIMNAQVTPLFNQFQDYATKAQTYLSNLLQIQTTLQNATTPQQQQQASAAFNQLVQGGGIVNAGTVQQATNDFNTVTTETKKLINQANNFRGQCTP